MKTFSLLLHKKILIFDMLFHFFILLISILIYFGNIEIADKDIYFFYVYFFVGGWQVLSFLFYYIFQKRFIQFEKNKREIYGVTLLIISTLLLFSFFTEFGTLAILLIILLFISPFLAIFYFFILLDELKNVNLKLKNT